MTDDAFGHWLAGFIDGEGCFQIEQARSARQRNFGCFCTFSITLRRDDEPILREIQSRLGIGYVQLTNPSRGNPAARWAIKAKADALVLVELLDRYPLRAKKAADYIVWREAVELWTHKGSGLGGREPTPVDDAMKRCRGTLRALRRYETSSHPILSINFS